MARRSREGHIVFLLIVGLLAWMVPVVGGEAPDPVGVGRGARGRDARRVHIPGSMTHRSSRSASALARPRCIKSEYGALEDAVGVCDLLE